MKLTSLVVQSFRGFSRRQSFALGDVNVFGGPNGFGKTSFFDSVLWCLFGSIPRLSGTRDFVQAGDVCQNKFSSSPYSVEITIATDHGPLIVKRTSNALLAMAGQGKLGEVDFLKMLDLQRDGRSRFLRNFLLQQETINDFVRDLNPRGRYDSLISMLEFHTPVTLQGRIEGLTNLETIASSQTSQNLAVAERQVFNLRGDLEKLRGLQKDISYEVAERRYENILRAAGVDLPGLGTEVGVPSQLRDRVMALVTQTTGALRTLLDLTKRLAELKRLKTENVLARNQETLKSEVDQSLADTTAVQQALSATEGELAKCENETSVRRATFEAANKAEGELRSALAAVRAVINSNVCPVCMRPIERDALLEIIDKQMGTKGPLLLRTLEDLNQGETLCQKLRVDAKGLREQLEKHAKKTEDLRRTLEDRRRFDSLLDGLRTSDFVDRWRLFSDDIDNFVAAVERMRVRVEALNNEAAALSTVVDRLSAMALIPDKEDALKNAMDEVDRLRRASILRSRSIATLNKCRDAVSKAQMTLLSTILESHRPLIRSLYKRMHPHPLFTDIDFEVARAYDSGELYFKVFSPERKVSAYPSTIFSLSQLNVLAVSVFLALNLRAESPLPIMMLDDPIHSMDDLNVLGFCDVVRQLRTKRQLFISTHNKDLYGLLLSKLRPTRPDESVRGFWFSDWSEEGPTVVEENLGFIGGEVPWSDMKELIGPSAA
jgi:DNA repair exonuclease SbcCD ATPase subunit